MATQPRNYSILTADLERNPNLLARLQRAARRPGTKVTVTTHGPVTTITAA
jgi:hypothetical protein